MTAESREPEKLKIITAFNSLTGSSCFEITTKERKLFHKKAPVIRMKKLLLLILCSVMMFAVSISVHAANGDTAGNIYATDIRAFVNGVEVPSYNIGGKTAVVIEDILMANSHLCTYNNATRTLTLYSLDPSYLVENKTQSNER